MGTPPDETPGQTPASPPPPGSGPAAGQDPPEAPKPAQHDWPARLRAAFEQHWGQALGLVIAAAFLLITDRLKHVIDRISTEPEHTLLVVAVLAAAGLWIAWRATARDGFMRITSGFLVGLVCYIAAFGLAARSELLVWRRDLTGLERTDLPRHWLAPARLGDWRYEFVARPRTDPRLRLITMDPPGDQTRGEARMDIAQLLAAAVHAGALGAALDFAFDSVPSDSDQWICVAVADAKRAGVAIVAGLDLRRLDGVQVTAREPPVLAGCLADVPRGHLLGYREAGSPDVRHIPLRLFEPLGMEALSVRIAALLEPEIVSSRLETGDPMLRLVEPGSRTTVLTFDALTRRSPDELAALLRGHFLLIGERSREETFATPFGPRLGVEIHAAAVHTLLRDAELRAAPPWLALMIILLGCYIITALAVAAVSWRRLVLVATGVTAFGVAAAILLAWQGVWLEVIYVAAAVWGLLVLLLLQRRYGRRPAVATAPAPDAAREAVSP